MDLHRIRGDPVQLQQIGEDSESLVSRRRMVTRGRQAAKPRCPRSSIRRMIFAASRREGDVVKTLNASRESMVFFQAAGRSRQLARLSVDAFRIIDVMRA